MVRTDECDLVTRIDRKREIIDYLLAIDCLREILYLEDILSDIPIRLERYIGESS